MARAPHTITEHPHLLDKEVSYSREYRRCGKQGCGRCAHNGAGHGPYWIARWTEDGKRQKQYLGTTPPPGMTDSPGLERAVPPLPASSAIVRVQVLGGFAVWHGDERIPDGAWARRKAGALLKCLVAAPGHRLRREELVEILWPWHHEGDEVREERGHGTGQRNLRLALHQARRLLDVPARNPSSSVIASSGDALALVVRPAGAADAPPLPPEDWLDASAFRRAADQALQGSDPATCRTALGLYGGSYLPEDLDLDAEWGRRWVQDERREVHRLCRSVRLRLADLLLVADEPAAAEVQLWAALRMEPTDTRTARRLMQLLIHLDRAGEALVVYCEVEAALKHDLGVAPGKRLMALLAEVRLRHDQD